MIVLMFSAVSGHSRRTYQQYFKGRLLLKQLHVQYHPSCMLSHTETAPKASVSLSHSSLKVLYSTVQYRKQPLTKSCLNLSCLVRTTAIHWFLNFLRANVSSQLHSLHLWARKHCR